MKPLLGILLGIILTASPSVSMGDWQASLEAAFPSAKIIETYDNYSQWSGGVTIYTGDIGYFRSANPSYFPGSQIDFYTSEATGNAPGTVNVNEYAWIDAREAKYMSRGTGKSLCLAWGNFAGNLPMDARLGPTTIGYYFGDGTANSGLSEVFVFWLMRFRNETTNIRTTGYTWNASGVNGEYYLTTSEGGNPNLLMPNTIVINGTYVRNPIPLGLACSSAIYGDHHADGIGSLTENAWTYGDNNSLGYDTIYVKLTGGANPQVQADGYIQYKTGCWVYQDATHLNPNTLTKFLDIQSGFKSDQVWQDDYPPCSDPRITQPYGGALHIMDFGFSGAAGNPLYFFPSYVGVDFDSGNSCYNFSSNMDCSTADPRWANLYSGEFSATYGPAVTSPVINDEWLAVEIREKISTPNTKDGAWEMWVYDMDGNVVSTWTYEGLMTQEDGPAGGVKYNRIRFGGNRYPYYNGSQALYTSEGIAWDNRVYIDDLIVNGSRVGPTYFATLAGYSGADPTCSDGVQNQGETGVDCGGPCTACPGGITRKSMSVGGKPFMVGGKTLVIE